MKKKLLSVLLAVLLVVSAMAIVACDNTVKHTVTFYDGTNVLKEVKVEDGKTVEAFTPQKEGYQFINWYSTPSYTHLFDFSKPITENVSVFAGLTLFTDDTREFYVVGSGTSELLMSSDWGKNITEDHKLTKVEGKNEYTITLDLLEGDEFQFAISTKWENKRGYGYLVSTTLEDGTVVFSGEGGGLGEVTAKGRNIKVALSGNYTLTLKTYPNEDTYNTNDTTYTEANKEVYNVGTFDTIEFVRNGDPLVEKVVVTNFYIKGSQITNWADMYNAATTMSKNGNVYTLSTYLKAGDEFMFASYNSDADGVTAGSLYIKSNTLDEASRQVVDGYSEGGSNMKAKTSGMHTFSYNKETNVLTVTVDATKSMPVYDYYLDGKTAAGLSWKEADLANNKLVETEKDSGIFEIKNVVLAVGDEILLRSYEQGATPSYSNKLDDYNAPYLLAKLAATENFSAVSASNANIKVLTAGTYNVSFNAYTKMITIASATSEATAYVKGSGIESWGNKPESGKMTKVDDKFELNLTMAVNDEIMIQYFAPGDETTYGTAVNASKVVAGGASANFDLTGGNIKCTVAGTYKIVYDPADGSITISEGQAQAVARAFVKGSAIESWANTPESGKMTLADGKFEIVIEMAVNDEIMIQYFSATDTTEWGEAYKASHVAAGTVNDHFDLSGSNIKCTTAGAYKIVLDVAEGKIYITEVFARAFVKGSAIESWANTPESGKMTEVDGKFEITLTIAVDDQLMIQYFAATDNTQWGAAFNASKVVAGGASANFNLTGNNIVCSVAGTYKLTFDPAAGSIEITAA